MSTHLTVTVHNDQPWLDTNGNIIDAHEPDLQWFEGRFWLYGTRFGSLSGFTDEHRMGVYSSPDLNAWTDHGVITPEFPDRLQANIDVKFCRRTGKYVLWMKANSGSNPDRMQGYPVLVSDHPAGPFELHSPNTRTHFPRSGDFSIYLDDDPEQTAYRICDTTLDSKDPQKRHLVHIERLTPDYLAGTGEISEVLCLNCEGNGMFKRNGTYFATTDNTCTFCKTGTGVRVYTAPDPLGPYTYRGNINRLGHEDPREIPSEDFDTEWGAGREDVIIHAQQRRVVTLQTLDGPVHLWLADRWKTAPDDVKGHDGLYISSPLQFDDDGLPRKLQWEDSWTATWRLP